VLPRPTRANKRPALLLPPPYLPLPSQPYTILSIRPLLERKRRGSNPTRAAPVLSFPTHVTIHPPTRVAPFVSIPPSRMSFSLSFSLSLSCVKANARPALFSLRSLRCCRYRVQPLRGDAQCDCSMMMIVLLILSCSPGPSSRRKTAPVVLGMYILDCFAAFLVLVPVLVCLALQSM
jgi:hypothetical protein